MKPTYNCPTGRELLRLRPFSERVDHAVAFADEVSRQMFARQMHLLYQTVEALEDMK